MSMALSRSRCRKSIMAFTARSTLRGDPSRAASHMDGPTSSRITVWFAIPNALVEEIRAVFHKKIFEVPGFFRGGAGVGCG